MGIVIQGPWGTSPIRQEDQLLEDSVEQFEFAASRYQRLASGRTVFILKRYGHGRLPVVIDDRVASTAMRLERGQDLVTQDLDEGRPMRIEKTRAGMFRISMCDYPVVLTEADWSIIGEIPWRDFAYLVRSSNIEI